VPSDIGLALRHVAVLAWFGDAVPSRQLLPIRSAAYGTTIVVCFY